MSVLADLTIGEHRLTCPECGRGPRDKTMGVTVDTEGAVAHCFRCSYVENYRDRRSAYRPGKPVFRPVVSLKRERLAENWFDFWRDACEPLAGAALDYLSARRCVIPPNDSDLRMHRALRHPSGYVGPALVALVTDVVTREPISLHRTWVQPDGTKPAHLGHAARMNLKGHRKQGGVIRLWPDECVSTGLAVGEGIETCLAMARDYTPVWSLLDAGNLATLPVLAGIQSLVIGADNDTTETGIKAATTCAARWSAAGVEVLVVMPETEGADWNDMEAA